MRIAKIPYAALVESKEDKWQNPGNGQNNTKTREKREN